MACIGCTSAPHDPSLRNVNLHYESRRVDELAAEGLRVDWQAVSGNLRVGDVVARRDGAVSARPQADGEDDGVQGTLRILEGQPGRIPAEVEAPAAPSMLTPYGTREEAASGESGYDVTPHVLADGRVRLDFARYDGRVAPPVAGDPVAPRTRPVATATVAPGAKVAVGGLARDSAAGGFTGFGSAPAREERVLVVWVEVEPPEEE